MSTPPVNPEEVEGDDSVNTPEGYHEVTGDDLEDVNDHGDEDNEPDFDTA